MQARKIQNDYLSNVLLMLLLLLGLTSTATADEKLLKDAREQQATLVKKYGLLQHSQWQQNCDFLIQSLKLEQFNECLLLDADFPNAYSLAHGVVILTRGLLENIRNDDQLAHVLAHEHAHLALNHHQQAMNLVKNPPKFFTKSRIKKFYRKIEVAADQAADELLIEHQRDPKQIHHYLIRIAKQVKESSNDHEKLKNRIQSNQLPAEKVETKWLLNHRQR